MPGVRLNQTEKSLKKWWEQGKTFDYPNLRALKIKGEPGLRGIQNLDIDFRYPLTVICGKNGSGKTTLLALSVLGFHSPSLYKPINARSGKYYTFQDFFFRGPSDPNITGLKITWVYDDGKNLPIQKDSHRWMRYERRAERPVYYIGVRRVLPAIEQRILQSRFKNNYKKDAAECLNSEYLQYLSQIMGREYSSADVLSDNAQKHSVRRAQAGLNTYSSFNMGTGEDILINLIHTLQVCPKGSLVVVEEIELGLHPEALRKLADVLQTVILEKKLQIILSTHSEHFIDSVPREARVLIQKTAQNHVLLPMPTTRYAIGDMSGKFNCELVILCEDKFATSLLGKALSTSIRKRINLVAIGADSELASTADRHLEINPEAKVLILWDGDVGESKIKNWMGGKNSKLHWCKLPGDVPPEVWVLQQLNCIEGYKILKEEFNLDSEAHSQDILQSLNLENDHHNIGYLLANIIGTSEDIAFNGLIASVNKLSTKPLNSICEQVKSIVEGNNVVMPPPDESGLFISSIATSQAG